VLLTKWEYRAVVIDNRLTAEKIEAKLNELGSEGWEFIRVISAVTYLSDFGPGSDGTGRALVLKRPVG
jgi:hypothetical protein